LQIEIIDIGKVFNLKLPNKELSLMNNQHENQSPLKKIWLAGGCFWGLQAYLDRLHGVFDTNVGYANGNTTNPTYEQVCSQNTGHTETVFVQYDSQIISLATLLKYFFKVVDPTSLNRQGNDRGVQYRSGIYYQDPDDLTVISEMLAAEQKKYKTPVVVEVLPVANYTVAEEYHQKYLEKNPTGYCHIDISALDFDPGTKQNNNSITKPTPPYNKPDLNIIQNNLTPLQFQVTQQEGTEPPFQNEYYDNHKPGLYVDIVTGEPLFSSRDKFDSGTGWPSFTKPIAPASIVTKTDRSWLTTRIEARSRYGNSHLGHVFEDGPRDRGGLRYCMNSAALRFIPLEKMQEQGYGEFIPLIIDSSIS
jgi:peptide methionine sulfoxide reductase msrA/msrB